MPRLFVGVPAPDNLQLGGVRGALEDEGDVKLVDPELYHVTLAFLGDTPEERVGAVSEALRKGAAGTPPEEGQARGLGAFPSADDARVVWAGVETEGLGSLAQGVRQALDELSVDFDDRHDFHAHLTLARLRDHRDLTHLLDAHETTEFGAFPVEQVHLYESALTPEGPEYEVRETVQLG